MGQALLTSHFASMQLFSTKFYTDSHKIGFHAGYQSKHSSWKAEASLLSERWAKECDAKEERRLQLHLYFFSFGDGGGRAGEISACHSL